MSTVTNNVIGPSVYTYCISTETGQIIPLERNIKERVHYATLNADCPVHIYIYIYKFESK